MSDIWVCKPDGTIQCDEKSKEIPLKEMRKELASIIGDENILDMEKRSVIVPTVCGFPTGHLNAYKITEEGEYILTHGIVGRRGFNPCPAMHNLRDKGKEEINIGHLIGTLTSDNPTTIKELVGHPLRVYKTGDALTLDWRPDRVNIETTKNKVIVRVWFG